MKPRRVQKAISTVLLTALIISGCARNQQIVDHSVSSLESELGSAIHQQILHSVPVYPEQTLNAYVQDVGARIASHADRKMDYRFVVLEDERIYATFAPGGYVYVTTGFFRFLQNEIELAGILAYEIAALQYKDPRLSRLKKSLDFVLRTGSYVAPAFGAIGALSIIGFALVDAAASGQKSILQRAQDADRKALQYLYASEYDPQGLIDSLYRMSDIHSPYRAYLYDYLQSHPIDVDRMNRVNDAFEKLPLENRDFEAGRLQFLNKTEIVRGTFTRK